MDIKVFPGQLRGTVQAPPSKSLAHRALICAALADGESVIRGISGSKDMDATIGCIRALGARVQRSGDECRIRGIFAEASPALPGSAEERAMHPDLAEDSPASPGSAEERTMHPDLAEDSPALLDCIESGSTLRFMLPVAAALGGGAAFTGRGKLPERPMTPLADEMKRKGVEFLPGGRDQLPFSIRGKLRSGHFTIPGNVSSQYISGLLFALPLLDGDSAIHISGKWESASYIALTLDMIRQFGVEVRETEDGFAMSGGQRYRACECAVEGDYSNGAFWLVAGAMGSELEVGSLSPDSVQGDRAVIRILRGMGACCEQSEPGQTAVSVGGTPSLRTCGGALRGVTVDCSDIPDIVPVLSVAAAAAEGETTFLNAGRLRIKESDRLAAMAEVLAALGADVAELEDSLTVRGSLPVPDTRHEAAPAGEAGVLRGGCEVDGHNDHRIVMSAAIAALRCSEPVIIRGAEAVTKSYPDFFDVFRALGGRADVIADR